jgi:hypothetical protein
LTAFEITKDITTMTKLIHQPVRQAPQVDVEQSGDSGSLEGEAATDAGCLPGVTTGWPRTADGRLICTPDRPMPVDARMTFGGSALWQHGDVEDIGECADGCCDRKRCKSCGVRWLASYGR